jgi:hypothetical protein
MKNILPPIHISPETALVVDDYPYGFRLRCKIRYWLEHDPKKGTRFCSQTTNPKVAGEVWNKPKKSTYCALGGFMFTDEQGHIKWDGLTYYPDAGEMAAWLDAARPGLNPETVANIEGVIAAKKIVADEIKRGEFSLAYCGMVGSLVGAKRKDGTVITLEEARQAVRNQIAKHAAAAA